MLPLTASAEDISVYLNGAQIEFDQPPILYNDRTFVPMRAVFEAFGMTVQWYGDEQRVTAFDHDTNITMVIGRKTVYKNNEGIESDVAPMIVNDRTLVPLRIIGELLGGDVEWIPESMTVTITGEFGEEEDNWGQRVLELTNEERAKQGLSALVWNDELAAIAQAHCDDMVERNFFDHNNPDGDSPFDRMKAAGISYKVAAENIAAGQASPEDAIDSWMNSEGHRKNILNPDLKELGVGMARGGQYGIYWTQNFATLL